MARVGIVEKALKKSNQTKTNKQKKHWRIYCGKGLVRFRHKRYFIKGRGLALSWHPPRHPLNVDFGAQHHLTPSPAYIFITTATGGPEMFLDIAFHWLNKHLEFMSANYRDNSIRPLLGEVR